MPWTACYRVHQHTWRSLIRQLLIVSYELNLRTVNRSTGAELPACLPLFSLSLCCVYIVMSVVESVAIGIFQLVKSSICSWFRALQSSFFIYELPEFFFYVIFYTLTRLGYCRQLYRILDGVRNYHRDLIIWILLDSMRVLNVCMVRQWPQSVRKSRLKCVTFIFVPSVGIKNTDGADTVASRDAVLDCGTMSRALILNAIRDTDRS